MFKKAGFLAVMLFGIAGALVPATAFAQDGYYYGRPNYYYGGDRDWNRHQREEWREHEREERREAERDRRWREHEWREHERWENRWNRGYYGNGYSFYYGYGR